jgi:hypothetical protein
LHFIQLYNNWEPTNHGVFTEKETGTVDSIAGCSFGHPSEVMLILVQELTRITSLVSDSKSKVPLSTYFFIKLGSKIVFIKMLGL